MSEEDIRTLLSKKNFDYDGSKFNKSSIEVILKNVEDDIAPAPRNNVVTVSQVAKPSKPSLETKFNSMLATVIQDDTNAVNEKDLEIFRSNIRDFSIEYANQIPVSNVASFQEDKVPERVNNQNPMSIAQDRQSNPFPLLPLHQCQICSRILSSKRGLKRHEIKIHTKNVFTCSECKYSTGSRSQLNLHKRKKT